MQNIAQKVGEIDTILPLCYVKLETSPHIFFQCDISRQFGLEAFGYYAQSWFLLPTELTLQSG